VGRLPNMQNILSMRNMPKLMITDLCKIMVYSVVLAESNAMERLGYGLISVVPPDTTFTGAAFDQSKQGCNTAMQSNLPHYHIMPWPHIAELMCVVEYQKAYKLQTLIYD
jgi:hypothetical protein